MAEPTNNAFNKAIKRIDELTRSYKAPVQIDRSYIEEIKDLFKPGDFLVDVKVPVPQAVAPEEEGEEEEEEEREEEEEGDAEGGDEGDAPDKGQDETSASQMKEFLGDTYTEHIMNLNKVSAMRRPKEIASDVIPRSWQLKGASKMRYLERSMFQGGICGDEMGLGKTLLVLLLINSTRSNREKAGPTLVICPKSCVKQWMRELTDNLKPEHRLKCMRLEGTSVSATTVLHQDVVVTTYRYIQRQYSIKRDFATAMASGHSAPPRPTLSVFSELYADIGMPFQRVILDESQNAKKTRGSTFAAIKAINTKSVIMLSATFMDNKWHDCWGSIALLQGHPIQDLKTFRQVFGTMRKKKWVDPDRTKIFRLQEFLQGLVVARPGSLLELPGREGKDIYFNLNEKESAMDHYYMEQYSKAWGNDDDDYGADNNKARLKAAMRAMQASSHPLLEKQNVEIEDLESDDDQADPRDENAAAGPTGQVKDAMASKEDPWLTMVRKSGEAAKSSRVEAFIALYRAVKLEYPAERVAVWSVMRKFLDIIEVALEQELNVSCPRYDGRVDEEGRDRVLRRFKEEGALKPLLITAKTGGVALNIQDATIIVQLEVWWNRNTERQAYARAHRQGQESDVKVFRLRAKNGMVDAEMLRVQQRKTKLNEKLMAPLVRTDDEMPDIPSILDEEPEDTSIL